MNIDKPLDDIIGDKRKPRAPRRGGRSGGQRKASAGQNNNAAAAAAAPAPAAARPAAFGNVHVGDKIIISGLPTDVDHAQVQVSTPTLSSSTRPPLTPVHASAGAVHDHRRSAAVLQPDLRCPRPVQGYRDRPLQEGRARHQGVPGVQQARRRRKWVLILLYSRFYFPALSLASA